MAAALAGEGLVRSGSSMNWRATSMKEMWNDQRDVFKRSGRQQEEEEELMWAAIERLPTFDRLRKGMLSQVMSNGRIEHGEVDVTKLEADDKNKLMDSILKVVEDDNEKFLRRIRDRIDRLVCSFLICLFLMWFPNLRRAFLIVLKRA